MGRKAKYATLAKYQPYIDIIRKDLGIPDDLQITFKFRPFRGATGGYANWPQRHIELSNLGNHEWTVQSLMHEYKHIQQYYQGRLDWTWIPEKHHRSGRRVANTGKWMQLWNGKLMTPYGASNNPQINRRYRNLPWEKEAYTYQDQMQRLFPNGELPSKRTLIGTASDGTAFYKVAK